METRTSTTSAHTITNLVVVEKTRTASYCENSRKPNVVCITVQGKIYSFGETNCIQKFSFSI